MSSDKTATDDGASAPPALFFERGVVRRLRQLQLQLQSPSGGGFAAAVDVSALSRGLPGEVAAAVAGVAGVATPAAGGAAAAAAVVTLEGVVAAAARRAAAAAAPGAREALVDGVFVCDGDATATAVLFGGGGGCNSNRAAVLSAAASLFAQSASPWRAKALASAWRRLCVLDAAATTLWERGVAECAVSASAPVAPAAEAAAAAAAVAPGRRVADGSVFAPRVAWRLLWDAVAAASAAADAAVDAATLLDIAVVTGAAPLLLLRRRQRPSLPPLTLRAAATCGLVAAARGLASPTLLFPPPSGAGGDGGVSLWCPGIYAAATAIVAERRVLARAIQPTGGGSAATAATLAAVCFGVDLSRSAAGGFAVADCAKLLVDAEAAFGGADAAASAPTSSTWFAPVDGSPMAAPYARAPHLFDLRVTWRAAWARLYAAHQEVFFATRAGFRIVPLAAVPSAAAAAAAAAATGPPTARRVVVGSEAAASSPAGGGDGGGPATAPVGGVAVFASLAEALAADASAGCQSVCVGAHPDVPDDAVSPISLERVSDAVAERGPLAVLTFFFPIGGGGARETACVSVSDLAAALDATAVFELPAAAAGQPSRPLTARTVSALKVIVDEALARRPQWAYFTAAAAATVAAYASLDAAIQKAAVRAEKLFAHAADLKAAAAAAPASPTLDGGSSGGSSRAAAATALRRLFDAAMFMRGWRGPEAAGAAAAAAAAPPLASEQTTYAEAEQPAVEVRVAAAIVAYDEALEAIADANVRRLVRSAPLLQLVQHQHRRGAQQQQQHFAAAAAGAPRFAPVPNMEQGISIEDRLAIVREGEATESIFSCLRMSSNVLAASAYYYLVYALEQDPPVANFDALDEIM